MTDATALVVGAMIGGGIFKKAAAIAVLLPNPPLVLAMWTVAGLLSLCGALALAELGAMYPRSGGLYVFLTEAYGPFFGYLFGWSMLAVLQTGSIAGGAAAVADVAARLLPMSNTGQMLLAGAVIVGLSWLNLRSVRAGADLQNVFTSAKSAGILLLILGGFTLAHGQLANLAPSPATPAGLALWSAFGLAMVKALWAYDGWVDVSFVAGEVREPQRNLPRALLLGTAFVIAVYVATNAVYHFVLPLSVVQRADKSVATDVAEAFLGAPGAVAITALILVSIFGTVNSGILTGARVTFAMARDRLFFPAVGAVHARYLTPHVAIMLQAVWSLALLGAWRTFEQITDNVVFVYWIFYALGAGACIVLRLRDPHRERSYRVPGFPWLPALFIVMAALLCLNEVAASPRSAAQALGLVAVGAVVYPLFRRAE